MKAMILTAPGEASICDVPEPTRDHSKLLLKIELVGLCGTDLNSFRGKNPLITFPRIPGHEIAATVLDDCHARSRSVSCTIYRSRYRKSGRSAPGMLARWSDQPTASIKIMVNVGGHS